MNSEPLVFYGLEEFMMPAERLTYSALWVRKAFYLEGEAFQDEYEGLLLW